MKINTLLITLFISLTVLSTTIEAKSFGGRSSSSSSSSRSISISRPSPIKSSAPSPSRLTVVRPSSKSAAPGSISSNNVARQAPPPQKSIQVVRTETLKGLGKSGAKGEQAGVLYKSFANQHKPLLNPNSTLSSNDINKAFDPGYRKQRRSDYYNGYQPTYGSHYQQTMASNSGGYGFWDYMMFNSILDNVGDRQMYYHHQSDPAFQQWRTDANSACAAGDQDVCDKLKDLDKEMTEYKAKGIQQNPKYLTPGVDPDIYEANNIDPKSLKEIKVCAGSIGSDYSRFDSQLTNTTKIPVSTIATNGSADNLLKMSTGECDLAWSQADLVKSNNLVTVLKLAKPELAVLICGNDSKIKTVNDITDKTTVVIGSDHTGSQFTFNKLRDANPKLKTAKIDTSKPILQATKDLKSTDCLFAVSTPNIQFVKTLDDVNKFKLISLNPEDFKDVKYQTAFITDKHYKNLTTKRFSGWDSWLNWFTTQGTTTFQIPTVLVTPQTWVDQNRQVFDLLMLESSKLQVALH